MESNCQLKRQQSRPCVRTQWILDRSPCDLPRQRYVGSRRHPHRLRL